MGTSGDRRCLKLREPRLRRHAQLTRLAPAPQSHQELSGVWETRTKACGGRSPPPVCNLHALSSPQKERPPGPGKRSGRAPVACSGLPHLWKKMPDLSPHDTPRTDTSRPHLAAAGPGEMTPTPSGVQASRLSSHPPPLPPTQTATVARLRGGGGVLQHTCCCHLGPEQAAMHP